jgi:sporulation protein YlmC with PRC-barrel domain
MNKLHKVAFYALLAPALTLSAGSLLAQQPSTQREQTPVQQSQPSTQRSAQPRSQQLETTRMGGSEYLTAAPSNAVRADQIMGSDVMTTGDENVGPVNDLIFDEEGQIIAIVVGVGGFLGMGEKDVAISWDSVTRNPQDRDELRVNATRDDLRAAPEFKSED